MQARDLLAKQLEDAEFQLESVIEGFPESGLDLKAVGATQSPRETLAHLCETYVAFLAHCQGEKHEWGTFKPGSTEIAALREEFRSRRAQAVEAALASESHYWDAHTYVVGHDYYHVGQLAAARIACDPAWDPYSIYR